MRRVRLFLTIVFLATPAFADESATWSLLQASGNGPPNREDHGMAFDPARRRFLVFAGFDAGATEFLNDTWSYAIDPPTGWSILQPVTASPIGRYKPAVDFDSRNDRLVVFGGITNTPTQGDLDLPDLWFLQFTPTVFWSQIAPPGLKPPGRWGATFVCNTAANRVLLFGGETINGPLGDLWQLNLGPNPTWTAISISGVKPTKRYLQSAVYDSIGAQMILFGGFDTQYLNDVWAFRGAHWDLIQPAGTPPAARVAATMVIDRRRCLVFGGWDGTKFLNDVWELRLEPTPAWTQLAPMGVPPRPRADHGAVFDPVTRRMLVFGGSDATRRFGDVWQLAIDEAVSTRPALIAADGARLTWIVPGAGGSTGWIERSEDGATGTTIASVTADPAGRFVFEDPDAVAGLPMAYRLRVNRDAEWVTSEWTWVRLEGVLALVAPSPARSAIALTWTLPQRGRGRLELFDTRGRRVWTRDVDASGTARIGEGLAPGLYWARLVQGDAMRLTRLIWLG